MAGRLRSGPTRSAKIASAMLHEGAHQSAVGGRIPRPASGRSPRSIARGPPPDRRRADGPAERPGGPAPARDRPAGAFQERRRHGERMNGRADVVEEAGEGQGRGPGPAADRRRGLDHQDGEPFRASVMAAARPFGPEPTTTPSYRGRMRPSLWPSRPWLIDSWQNRGIPGYRGSGRCDHRTRNGPGSRA